MDTEKYRHTDIDIGIMDTEKYRHTDIDIGIMDTEKYRIPINKYRKHRNFGIICL
jgi:hypothetical protein